MKDPLAAYLSPLPLVAVLRGIMPEEVLSIAETLVATGFRILEVPLNSPRSLESISALAQNFGESCLVGAGTVLEVDDVTRVRRAGARLIVMPHTDLAVVRKAKRHALVCMPGVATPTEAFAALAAGADGLKMFPAEALSPAVVKAWCAVFPRGTRVFPVGGIMPDTMEAYWAAGASGFGIGSSLYRRGASASEVRAAAAAFVRAFQALLARCDPATE